MVFLKICLSEQKRHYKLKGLLILFILITSILFLISLSHVNALNYNEKLDKVEYITLNQFTKFSIDDSEYKEGTYSFRFDAKNIKSWMSFNYVPENSLNLSKNMFIVMWIRIKNTSIVFPLNLIFEDIEGRKSCRYLVDDYGLLPLRWARIAIDPSNFDWAIPDFDKSRIVRIRFNSNNNGKNYSQSVWIDDLKIITYGEQNVQSIDSYQGDWFIAIGIFIFLFISLLVGFTTFQLIGLSAPKNSNLPLMFPIYLAIGISSQIVISSLLSFVYINILIIFVIIMTSIIILIKKTHFIPSLTKFKISTYSYKNVKLLLPILIFSLSFLRFTYLATSMGWAPIVDPQTHGMFTSLILKNNRIPLSFSSEVNTSFIPITYPFGFHVLSAFVTILTNLIPGQSMLVVSTAVTILIPSMIFSAVYLSTDSAKLSTIAFLFTYYLPNGISPLWMPSHDMLLGPFIVGLYPNLLGNMIFITLFSITIIYDDIWNDFSVFFVHILLLLSLLISYYPLLPFAILYMLLKYIINQKDHSQSFLKNLKILTVIIIIIISVWYLFSQKSIIIEKLELDIPYYHTLYLKYRLYNWDSPYIIYTILMYAALPISILFIFKNTFRNIGLIHIILFLTLIFGHILEVYTNLLWFTMLSRLLILGVTSSYLVLSLGAHSLFYIILVTYNRFFYNKGLRIFSRVLILLTILLFFTPSLIGHLTYTYPLYDFLPHGNDLAAMKWMIINADEKDLILNDISHTSYWLNSFKVMNIINEQNIHKDIYIYDKYNGTYIKKRMIEANEILSHPWDYEMIENTVQEYNILYIYISEGPQVKHIGRGVFINIMPWKNISQEERVIIYMQNPILDVAYRSGNVLILKVCGREKM